jgi:hypothetical protein
LIVKVETIRDLQDQLDNLKRLNTVEGEKLKRENFELKELLSRKDNAVTEM